MFDQRQNYIHICTQYLYINENNHKYDNMSVTFNFIEYSNKVIRQQKQKPLSVQGANQNDYD